MGYRINCRTPEATLGRLAASFAGLTRQRSFPFEREQEHRFINLRDTRQCLRHGHSWGYQETVTLALSRPDMDAETFCNVAKWATVPQRFGLPQPFHPLVQSGVRCAAQSVERPPARVATTSLQAISFSVPVHMLASAMWTSGSGRKAAFNDSDCARAGLQGRHLGGNLFELALRQLPQYRGNLFHGRLVHTVLLDVFAHLRHDAKFPPQKARHMSLYAAFANRALFFMVFRLSWRAIFVLYK
jgi:hypothetical protein